jgi:hypothetical protein
VLAPDITQNFSASVVTRLYDIASTVELSYGRQKHLALFFTEEDSLMADQIKKGVSPQQIRKLQNDLQAKFQQILTSKDCNQYYTAKFHDQARLIARQMADLAKQKYDCDTATLHYLTAVYYRRQLSLNKAFYSQFTDSTDLDRKLLTILQKDDSLLEHAIYLASGNAYLKTKIAQLNAIKPISPDQETGLRNAFYSFSSKFHARGMADNFNEALRKTITDTTYYGALYKEEIDKMAAANTLKYLSAQGRTNKISDSGYNRLSKVVYQKERLLAIYNKTYPYFSHTLDDIHIAIETKYDSITKTALMREGIGLPSSQYTSALRNAGPLGLSTPQIDSLIASAYTLQKMKDAYAAKNNTGRYDSKSYESTEFTRILTPEQFTKVLIINNRDLAKTNATSDWQDLQKRGLDSKYDKETTIKQLTAYYLAREVAYYRNAADKLQQDISVRKVDDAMPDALKVLKTARKYNNPANSTTGSFQW